MRRRVGLLAVVVLAFLLPGGALSSQRAAEAALVQSQINDVCGQIPSLLAALDYTTKTWPLTTVGDIASQDYTWDMAYFGGMVGFDKGWCDRFTAASNPELVRTTLLWHFGNASVALGQYQAAVRNMPTASAPASAPTAAPQATATPVRAQPTPVPTVAPPPATVSQCSPTVNTRLSGRFNGFAYGSTFTFYNGQVWRQVDRTVSDGLGSWQDPFVRVFPSGSVCLMQLGVLSVNGPWEAAAAIVERIQ